MHPVTSIMLTRGALLGAVDSIVTLVIFYRLLSPALGVQQTTVVSFGVRTIAFLRSTISRSLL
jgi:hypothetical protein